jgi:hypothetical protein
MGEPLDLPTYVRQAAAVVGLPIAEEDFGDVVAAFAVLARVSGPVMAFPLPEDVIAAAVFTPDDGAEP